MVLIRDQIEVVDLRSQTFDKNHERRDVREEATAASPVDLINIGGGERAALLAVRPGVQAVLLTLDFVDARGRLTSEVYSVYLRCDGKLRCAEIDNTEFLVAIGEAALVEDEGRIIVLRQATLRPDAPSPPAATGVESAQ